MKMNSQMNPSRRRVVAALAGVAVLSAASGGLAGCTPEKPKFQSVDLTGADYARGFSLLDQNGQLRTVKDFAGKVVVVFFGFTQCPDVCPASMAELSEVKRLLGTDGNRLQAIFITVDPERDTPERLQAYMTTFDPTFLALRPAPAERARVASDFKIFYKKVDGKTSGSYSVDHSAGSYIYDPQGRVRLYNRYGSGAEMLAADIRLLLKAG